MSFHRFASILKWPSFVNPNEQRELRFFIALFFILTLFLFLHFREARVEILELNSVAERYIVAQVDFTFRDEEATLLLRNEAMRDIGPIYRVRSSSLTEEKTLFEKSLVEDQSWRETVVGSSFEQFYLTTEELETELAAFRFTDPTTMRKLDMNGLGGDHFQIFTIADIDQGVVLPGWVWNLVRGRVLVNHKVVPSVLDFVITRWSSYHWLFEVDQSLIHGLREKVAAKIPDKFTKVSAGSRIIDQGEIVRARHIAMLQAMKRAMNDSRNLFHPETLFGSLLMAILLSLIMYNYLSAFHPKSIASSQALLLLAVIVFLTLLLSKSVEFFLLATKGNLMEVVRYPLLTPFAAFLLCSCFQPSLAMFVTIFLTILLAIILPFERQGFMIINLAAAVMVILGAKELKRRKDIFGVSLQAWMICALFLVSIHLYQGTFHSFALVADLVSTLAFMLVSAILVLGILPLLESEFNVMSRMTLMEYMDPSHPLLRRMTIETPGTYQHSLVVGSLAEAAAAAIGADALFCRVVTLFHDVGKLVAPQYFTENQVGGMNIHQLLTPKESAQVIIAHVSEGKMMAERAALPDRFSEIIQQHHGTTLVRYFYSKQLDLVGGDVSKVDEESFRYPGPKPKSREAAIIMIADSLEAASRSLDEVNEESLTQLVDLLIRSKAEDHQFDNCPITYEELEIVKKTLVATLMAAGHSRIKYPAAS